MSDPTTTSSASPTTGPVVPTATPPASAPAAPPPPAYAPPPPPPPRPPRPPRRGRGPAKPPNPVVRVFFGVVGGAFTLFVLAWGTLAVINLVGHVTEVDPVAFGANVKAVVVRSGAGPIAVRGSERSDIRGERTVEHGWQNPTIDEHMEGDTLVLNGHCDFAAVFWCEVSYSLDVPRGVRLDLQSGAGAVTVSGVDGDVEARSGAGGVEATDCHGDLTLASGAGRIRGTQLTSLIVNAESGAGGVDLQFVVAPTNVTATSGAGSIDVEVPHDGTSYQVSGDSGHGGRNIGVATAPTSAHSIHLQSGAGSTRIHYPAT